MLKLYNTLSRKKENFTAKNKRVNFFVCGPTVSLFSHIGHARTYIIFDVIVKYLRRIYDVFYLQNITDIDDKIIERAQNNGYAPADWAKKYEKEYYKDIKALKIDSVSKYERATDHIKEIISQTKRLIDKGYAYKLKDGIYYDISKFKNYGKLSGRTKSQADDGVSRIDEDKSKKNKGDFCLWKFSKASEPKWKSPWGDGRPGWHIEDTAISEKHFGQQYDIHGGARDLMFPHHEAEIAQMEAISGKSPFVRYWMHTGFLTVEGRKMSKSLGNFITIRDFLKENPPRLLRFFITKNHYRSPIDYNEKMLSQSKKELEKIDDFIEKLDKQKTKGKTSIQVSRFEKAFKKAMDDDFNTPKAIASIFELVKTGNSLLDKNKLNKADAEKILKFLKETDKIFDFIFFKEKQKTPDKILKLAEEREKARKNKDWKKSDQLRDKIKNLGYHVEDTAEGPKIKKA